MGVDVLKSSWNEQADEHNQWDSLGLDEVIEFAQAVEREACAKICDSYSSICADAIRARANSDIEGKDNGNSP